MNGKLLRGQQALLLISGTVLALIGTLILTSPVEFYASNEIELGTNLSLLNELKAPAGMLLAAGVFMLCAIFVRRLVEAALAIAAFIYLSYGATRFTTMAFDGMPAPGLVQAASLEMIIGLACLSLLLVAHRAKAKELG